MTGTAAPTQLPALRHGGGLRRALVLGACVALWVVSATLLSAGFVPQLDGDETELSIRVTFLLLGVALALLPVVAVWLPHRRLVTRLLEAVLATNPPRQDVPPVETWASPVPAFQRLRSTAYVLALIPLLSLLITFVGSWTYLDEDAAAIVALVFSVVPLIGLVVTLTLPKRVVANVRAGADAGQVLPVRVPGRVDLGAMTWFEACLPGGQRLLLRTPARSSGLAEPRGVVESPDVLLLLGAGGHHGALLVPARPEDVIWLQGPVPQPRVPRDVLRAFAELAASAG